MKRGLAAGFRFLVGLLAMTGLVLLGIWVANTWILPAHVGSALSFSMPSLRGLSRDEVYAVGAEKELVLSEKPAEYDASLPSGYLIRQIPEPGVSIKPGRRVSVVFSAGPKMVVLPDLGGQTERQARLSLEDRGLIPGDLVHCAGNAAAGHVLASRPGPGALVPVGAVIDLLLSRGAASGGFLVPEFRGRKLTGALALMEGSGLPEPKIRYRIGSGLTEGDILEQMPPPGSRLERGRTLELVVASKEE
ncbi:MAG: PASTA domain-containing protein [bacterium]|nr:PASTA domain-containing protein [bacterium]